MIKVLRGIFGASKRQRIDSVGVKKKPNQTQKDFFWLYKKVTDIL